MLRPFARVVLVTVAVVLLAGCGSGARRDVWTLPAADLSGTRAAAGSSITARNVHRLHVRWRFGLRSPGGVDTSTPVVDATSVYVENLYSNVFALDRRTGKIEWAHRYETPNDRPNGLAVDGGRVYGTTRGEVFALAELNGRELWKRHLTTAREQSVDSAPVPWQGLVFVRTTGAIAALEAATGKTRWRFPLPARGRARGPVSVNGQGRLFVGTSGPLLVLDAGTGRLLWRALAATPLLAGDDVVGAGKGGRVVAWNTTTQRRLWQRAAGSCSGGVETPMAYADGRLFVPVVDVCAARGRIVALAARSGRILWQRQLRTPGAGCAAVANDVVFTTSDGTVDGFATRSGALLWRARIPADSTGCPAVAGDTLYVGTPAIVAFSLSK